MSSQALFLLGLLVSAFAVAGLVITVLEFRKIESGQVPRNQKFPM